MKYNLPLWLGIVSIVSLIVLGSGCRGISAVSLPAPASAIAVPQVMASATQQGEGIAPPVTVSTIVPSDNSSVTLADNGKDISIRQGSTITLALDNTSSFDWTISVSDPSILTSISTTTSLSHTQGMYKGSKVGQATIITNGEPKCRKSIPQCGMPSVHFTIQISVI